MPGLPRDLFDSLLARYARADVVADSDMLFGSGLDITSIAFTEFILELEERLDTEIDIDSLDASIRTVGQLYTRLAGTA